MRLITFNHSPAQITNLHKKLVTCGPHAASDSHSKQTGDHETISPTASLFVPPAAVDFAILDSCAHYLGILSDVADHAGARN
jgi:hypothetical protein